MFFIENGRKKVVKMSYSGFFILLKDKKVFKFIVTISLEYSTSQRKKVNYIYSFLAGWSTINQQKKDKRKDFKHGYSEWNLNRLDV